jgi:hypothetical protein
MEVQEMRLWHLRDLITDHQTGKLRETAIWSNIGKAALTYGLCHQIKTGTLTEWFVAAYGAVVIMHEVAARVMNQRQQKLNKEEDKP